eukprot:CAMPEP_0185746462 /NCGR_PEP_ID=MMETSP1174-20130828/5034_1 /TAXON_ID=35687 /ORGANISM="Dictyocha speculum, Strain CCMP1381" /LENGTH=284 /DNA_ID=CAMNT_0028421167 /DNA_START=115 /DNA_END=969 /DNA_ORIENTATION=+
MTTLPSERKRGWPEEAAVVTATTQSKLRRRVDRSPIPEFPSHALSTSQDERGYYRINLRFAGLQLISTAPAIFLVPGFLTHTECDHLRAKAGYREGIPFSHVNRMERSTVGLTADPVSRVRTSSQVTCTQRESPSVVAKLTALCACDAGHLEKLSVVCYTPGQRYEPHVDEDDGPDDYCNGFVNSQRLVTVLVYLNDVASRGGHTRFVHSSTGLSIKPKMGMAVVHFPSTDGSAGFVADPRTEHEGAKVSQGEKWILTTWVHSAHRTGKAHLEERINRLSLDDI